jgi:deazaflavin-dependent oxidoreductase (nitroreductase family)
MLNALRRIIQRTASTRAGAWFFARTVHRLDLPVIRLSKGQHSLTSVLAGLPVVTLTTVGARSGRRRTTPLVAIRDGEKVVLIASNFGRAHHPAWYHNLRANPEARLTIHGRTGHYVAREVTGAKRERCWERAVDLYAGYAAYKERAGGREIPVMVLMPRRGNMRIRQEND